MERARIQSDLDCRCVDCVSCNPVGMGCTVPADGYSGSFGPWCPVMDDITYWERFEALGDDSYDYDVGVDRQPGFFDYDDPRDYEEWCDWNDVDIE